MGLSRIEDIDTKEEIRSRRVRMVKGNASLALFVPYSNGIFEVNMCAPTQAGKSLSENVVPLAQAVECFTTEWRCRSLRWCASL